MAQSVDNITIDDGPPLTNQVSQDVFLHYVGRQERLEEEIKAKRKEKSKLRREMRNNGIRLTDMDLALKMRNIEDDDVILESMRTVQRYAKYLDLPIGTQLSFLDEVPATPTDSDALDKAAYDRGRRAGALGEWQDDNPYQVNSSQGQQWLKGHGDAQAALVKEMAPEPDEKESESEVDEQEELQEAAE